MAGLSGYIRDSFKELKNNVTWTPWPKAQNMTIIVLVFSVLFALAVWGIDSVFAKAVQGVFNLLG